MISQKTMQRFILVMKSKRTCFKELRMMLRLVFKALILFMYVDRRGYLPSNVSNHIQSGTSCINFFSDFHLILFLNTCRLFPYQFYLFFERGLASSNNLLSAYSDVTWFSCEDSCPFVQTTVLLDPLAFSFVFSFGK